MAEPGPAKVLSWPRFLVLGAPEHPLAVGGSESRVPRQIQELGDDGTDHLHCIELNVRVRPGVQESFEGRNCKTRRQSHVLLSRRTVIAKASDLKPHLPSY